MAIAANAGDPPDGTARKGFKVQILNSKFKSNTIQGPHMLTLWEATGRVRGGWKGRASWTTSSIRPS